MRITIHGRNLPGRTWCDQSAEACTNVHVAVQMGSDPEGLVAGDAPSAEWRIDVAVTTDADGEADFKGPAVHGKRRARFLYLTWGDVADDGSFSMFRRAKLMLNDVDAALVRQAEAIDAALVADVNLTDEHGGPRCARVGAPALSWSLGAAN